MEYNPLFKRSELVFGSGEIVIVAGWYPLSTLQKWVPEGLYAAAGNLFSPNLGISYLIKNLLANPKIQKLVILNMTHNDRSSKSCQVFIDLLRNGYCRQGEHLLVNSGAIEQQELMYLDPEITSEHLDELLDSLSFVQVNDKDQLLSWLEYTHHQDVSSLKIRRPFTHWKQQRVDTLGAHLSDRTSSYESTQFYDLWINALKRVQIYGFPQVLDGELDSLTLHSLTLQLGNEKSSDIFKTLVEQGYDADFLDNYLEHYLHPCTKAGSDVPEGSYTYQDRLFCFKGNLLTSALKRLATLDLRKAYISLWDSELDSQGAHVPCLTSLQFQLHGPYTFNLDATMRSCDLYSAFPCNCLGLRRLHEMALEQLKQMTGRPFTLGVLRVHISNAHILNARIEESCRQVNGAKLSRRFSDSAGLYTFVKKQDEGNENKSYQLEWSSYSGFLLKRYDIKLSTQGFSKLMQQIISDNPEIEPAHAVYLLEELHALLNSEIYKVPFRQR